MTFLAKKNDVYLMNFKTLEDYSGPNRYQRVSEKLGERRTRGAIIFAKQF